MLQRHVELFLKKDWREWNKGSADDAPDREWGKEANEKGMEDRTVAALSLCGDS